MAADDPKTLCFRDDATGRRALGGLSAPVVGVFDSGVGGLSVVREILVQVPGCSVIYVADHVHAPYGERTEADVRMLSEGISRFLRHAGAEVIVLACNSASAAALYALRELFPETSFIGMEPAVKPAVERTKRGKIGVIATAVTLQGEPYAGVIRRYAHHVDVVTRLCPRFVPLVEAGDLHSDTARDVVRTALAPLRRAGIDELVLGCTHYTFLKPLIEEIMGDDVEVIDPAAAVARHTGQVLRASSAPNSESRRDRRGHVFVTTDDVGRLTRALDQLLRVQATVVSAQWCAGRRRSW